MQRKWHRYILTCIMMVSVSGICQASFSIGDRGSDVTDIQRRLVQDGIHVTVDGCYGSQTRRAVMQFQRQKHLPADGVVGQSTYHALTGHDMRQPVLYRCADNSIGTSGQAAAVMREAQKYVGTPYRFGGAAPGGFDCSGFTSYVYSKNGIYLPRSADAQYEVGTFVSMQSLKPGDLVFFSTYAPGVSHSGIYVGNGNFISATSSRGVSIQPMESGYWREHYIGAKRVL